MTGDEMSAKERVLAVYPDARAFYYSDGAVAIVSESHREEASGSYLGWGQTTAQKTKDYAEADSWEDAATRLPSPQVEGATQTGGPNECSHGYAAGIHCPACDAENSGGNEAAPQVAGVTQTAGTLDVGRAYGWLVANHPREASRRTAELLHDYSLTVLPALRDDNKEAKHG